MKSWMLLAVMILALFALALNGCSASWFACTTKASFNKDGTWSYESCKNQENMEVKITEQANGKTTAELKTTSTTPEAAMAAALQGQLEMQKQLGEMMKIIIPLAKGFAGVP